MSLSPTAASVLWIFGAGGHGRVVADAAKGCRRWADVLFFDDALPEGEVVGGCRVAGGKDRFLAAALPNGMASAPQRHVAIGNNARRDAFLRHCEHLGLDLATVVHPAAVVSPQARLGPAGFVGAGAVIAPGAEVGVGVIVNHLACVDHDCRLERGAHIGPGVHLGGEVAIGVRTWVGIGAAVRNRIRIGADALVGAGAVVVSDVADNIQVVGNPARPMARSAHA